MTSLFSRIPPAVAPVLRTAQDIVLTHRVKDWKTRKPPRRLANPQPTVRDRAPVAYGHHHPTIALAKTLPRPHHPETGVMAKVRVKVRAQIKSRSRPRRMTSAREIPNKRIQRATSRGTTRKTRNTPPTIPAPRANIYAAAALPRGDPPRGDSRHARTTRR